MEYTYEYETSSKSKEFACMGFILDNFLKAIPNSLVECVDYVAVVENVLKLKVEETEKGYVIISEKDVEELKL